MLLSPIAMLYCRPYVGWVVLVLLCCACEAAAPTPPVLAPTPTPPVVHRLEDYSALTQGLLLAQQRTHATTLGWMAKGKRGQLPQGSEQLQTHLKAVLGGSQSLLRPHYRQVSTVGRRLTQHLDLSFQNLCYLPDWICRRPDLRYLSLSNNQLRALNPLLGQCQQLRKLDLSSNGLARLPEGLLRLTQLQELVLTDNLLYTLPPNLALLRGLKILDIGNLHPSTAVHHNNIQQFPRVLLQMPQLQKLFLDKLPLRQLPYQLSQLYNLQVLSLNGNRAMYWGPAFQALARLPQLIALDISFIGRSRLPESIRQLQGLKILIWHEENQRNQAFVENTLRHWLPNTKIYYGKKGVATPFLRGNSIATIKNIAEE